VAWAYPGQDGREQQPEQFEHASGSQIYPRARLCRPTAVGDAHNVLRTLPGAVVQVQHNPEELR
jgi:hypothetical protein